MEESMSRLARDLLAEILSRVPYKSLCICKSVCPAWRDIIADPVYRKKISRSLVRFFYQYHVVAGSTAESADPCGFSVARGVSCVDLSAYPWASVPRTCPRLQLPPDTDSMEFSLRDSCDGLFLTHIPTGTPDDPRTRYVVSNPATGEYALLPHSGYHGDYCSAYLVFRQCRVCVRVHPWRVPCVGAFNRMASPHLGGSLVCERTTDLLFENRCMGVDGEQMGCPSYLVRSTCSFQQGVFALAHGTWVGHGRHTRAHMENHPHAKIHRSEFLGLHRKVCWTVTIHQLRRLFSIQCKPVFRYIGLCP
uniref:Uncharacterized protein n=1 Tax=Avena sativa TaxID=4498 RepID=A0ACD5Z825_AVESA